MSVSTITVGGQSVTLVSTPAKPNLRSVEFQMLDQVGMVPSTFTGQIAQAQAWPGADLLSATLTLPPLTSDQEDDWAAFLMQMRGQFCAFLWGDPTRQTPRGTFAGTPVVDGTVTGGNPAMSQMLALKGFTHSATGVAVRGDYIQVGYRLYRNLDNANADSSGKAVLNIYPSLRESPADGTSIVTTATKGLWRLATNKRGYSKDVTRLAKMSFQIQEYR